MLRMSEVNATNHQTMQHMLTEATVNWRGLGDALAVESDALLGGEQSVLLLDESAFAKKGESSAGVARQWNGRLGKVDNCQVGVFASQCKKAAIPEAERRYRSKSELALTMVDEAVRRGVRFGAIAVDGGYGKEPAFLRQLDRRRQRFVADVHCDQHVYLEDPRPAVPAGSGRGRQPRPEPHKPRRYAWTTGVRPRRWAHGVDSVCAAERRAK